MYNLIRGSRMPKFWWRTRYSVLLVLIAVNIVCLADRMILPVVIPFIAKDFHLSPSSMGVAISVFYLGYSIMHIPGGLLADRFGSKRVATVAMLWWSICTAITGATMNLAQLLFVRLLFGLGEGVYPPTTWKIIANWFPTRERATASALLFAGYALGLAISPLIAVSVMSIWGWRNVFFIMFFPGVIMAMLLWLRVPDNPFRSARVSSAELDELAELRGQEDTGAPQKMKDIIREPYIIRYFFALFAYNIAYWGFTTWLPTYLISVRKLSMVEMGIASSLPAFAGVAGSMLGGVISDRLFSERRRVPLVAFIIISAVLLWMTYAATSITTVVICQTLAGLTLNMFYPAFWVLPVTNIPQQRIGVASGFINMAGQIAAFISPMLIGLLVQIMGGDYLLVFILLIVALAVSLLIILTIPTARGAKTAAPPEPLEMA